jgi:hypothetical protein
MPGVEPAEQAKAEPEMEPELPENDSGGEGLER